MFDEEFEAFWRAYPSKVGKLAARKVYEKVRRGGIRQDELLDGITQYIATKPAYADYCHPRTWLSQGRWMDEAKPRADYGAARMFKEPTPEDAAIQLEMLRKADAQRERDRDS